MSEGPKDLLGEIIQLNAQNEHLKKCLNIALEKAMKALVELEDIQRRYQELVRERGETRQSLQKEIRDALKREEPWLFDND